MRNAWALITESEPAFGSKVPVDDGYKGGKGGPFISSYRDSTEIAMENEEPVKSMLRKRVSLGHWGAHPLPAMQQSVVLLGGRS